MSAILAALFKDHATAENVRTRLVSDGFPTDRVELSSRTEPGQVQLQPAESFDEKLQQYFSQLFDGEEERRLATRLAERVSRGCAAIVVHPRGDIETHRAIEILEAANPAAIEEHDLGDQTLEQAASPSEKPLLHRILMGDQRTH